MGLVVAVVCGMSSIIKAEDAENKFWFNETGLGMAKHNAYYHDITQYGMQNTYGANLFHHGFGSVRIAGSIGYFINMKEKIYEDKNVKREIKLGQFFNLAGSVEYELDLDYVRLHAGPVLGYSILMPMVETTTTSGRNSTSELKNENSSSASLGFTAGASVELGSTSYISVGYTSLGHRGDKMKDGKVNIVSISYGKRF